MLKIKNLHASIDGKKILRGINLTINVNEVHAIMGPNGGGKSTLSNILTGRDGYTITQGEIIYKNEDLLALKAEEIARRGIFLAFQYPIEISGVSNIYLLKAALNAIREYRGLDELDAIDFLSLVRSKLNLVKMDEAFLNRGVNEGFSGGEKKRNEILQMILLEPSLAILDETDSGLDIDSLRIISDGVNTIRSSDRSIVLITHYQRLLNHIIPDFVHVLSHGRIVKSGNKELAKELEKTGYNWINGENMDMTS